VTAENDPGVVQARDAVLHAAITTVLTTTLFSGRSTGTVQGKQVARRQAPIAML